MFNDKTTVFLTLYEIRTMTYQTMLALEFLHRHGYVHRNLSSANVLLDEMNNNHVKLSRYGLYHMTHHNADVRFPIGDVR